MLRSVNVLYLFSCIYNACAFYCKHTRVTCVTNCLLTYFTWGAKLGNLREYSKLPQYGWGNATPQLHTHIFRNFEIKNGIG